MNLSSALPRPSIQPRSRGDGVVSGLISRLRSLVSAGADRDGPDSADMLPYSYLAECECPDDCLRDHENE
jgi:hypothetical protein